MSGRKPDLLEALHRVGVSAVGGVEIGVGPVRQAEKRGGRPTAEMVVLTDELERPARVADRAFNVAEESGEAGPVDGD